MYKITSEIYEEAINKRIPTDNGNIITIFKFYNKKIAPLKDKDNDFILRRHKSIEFNSEIHIEHSAATELRTVGLQVWRGALLLADYLCHHHEIYKDKKLMELGAGVGLTSIAFASLGQKVITTDINIAGLLDLLRNNVARNKELVGERIQVLEYDFMQSPNDYTTELINAIDNSEIFAAADIIYDDVLTDAFIQVLTYIFEREIITNTKKIVLIALEKRYVFTLNDLDTVPPMFDYFLKQIAHKPWQLHYIPINFPQYFQYKRSEQLILFKITINN